MTSRQSQAAGQSSKKLPLSRKLLNWLIKGAILILLILGVFMLFIGLETWRRHQEVLSKLGNDPIMSKNLLGMKLIKQEIKVDSVLFNWKPTSPELINYFDTDGNQQEVFDRLIRFAKDNGWMDIATYEGNERDLRFLAKKKSLTLHARIYPDDKKKFRVYISNQ